jgi:hypothetical protein
MKKVLFISAVAAVMLLSGCGGGGGSSSSDDATPAAATPAATTDNTTQQVADNTSSATDGSASAADGGTASAASNNGITPEKGNNIKDGLHDDGTTNRPVDQVVTIGDRDWLVIQTSELKDDNSTSSFSEAFFPKRTWAEADYFCKNFKDEKNPNATWSLPTQIELLSIMTPTVEDVRKFDETTSQFVVDAKVLPSEGTVDAFHSAIFYNVENKTVYLGNGSLGSAQISYTAIDKGQPEEALFTCIKQ